MGKEAKGGIVDKFLSKPVILKKKESFQEVPENKKAKKEPKKEIKKEAEKETKKEARYYACRYKRFYLDKKNELKLKKLQFYFIEKGERLNESELINRAISYFYSFIVKSENIEI
jgi:hypothetical protein